MPAARRINANGTKIDAEECTVRVCVRVCADSVNHTKRASDLRMLFKPGYGRALGMEASSINTLTDSRNSLLNSRGHIMVNAIN